MLAPQRFVQWMGVNLAPDDRPGYSHAVYRYNSRSDAHSVVLCRLILDDLLQACEKLRIQAQNREVVYGINVLSPFISPWTGKSIRLDLAIGPPHADTPLVEELEQQPILAGALDDVSFSCEAKTTMTEHIKQQPRLFRELNSSHAEIHHGSPRAIAAGITVVNIANSFISPLRQVPGGPIVVSPHRQPDVAASVVQHLRGLPLRDAVGQVGFDAYATIVVENDNTVATPNNVHVHLDPPAPQPGDPDHYETFVTRICRFYEERF